MTKIMTGDSRILVCRARLRYIFFAVYSNQPEVFRYAARLYRVFHLKFAQYFLSVPADGVDTEAERFGYFFACEAPADETQHLLFSCR